MIKEEELKAQDVRMAMQEIAKEHLSLEADGYVITSEMVYDSKTNQFLTLSKNTPLVRYLELNRVCSK